MVDRIRALLLARQLSPTQFADAIGVARPIVSHIMSGRNKPSLEVVQKVLAAFPDLSMPWLLNGSGPMLATAEPPTTAEIAPATAVSAPRRRPVPVPPPPVAPPLPANEAAEPFPAPEAKAGAPAAPTAAPVLPPLPEPTAPVAAMGSASAAGAAVPAVVGLPPELALFAEPGKAIRRIVIFYRDGTFADYQPE